MKVISIKKVKDGKYKIIGDETFILYDEVILKNNILFKKDISDEFREKLLKENEKYDAINKILKYINKKIRSKKEINNYLKKFELNRIDNEFVINYLSNLNVYNDSVFAESYIYDKFHLSSDGPSKIKKELLKHNIDDVIINEKMSIITLPEVEEKLTKLILKKIKLNHKYSNNDLVKKGVIDLVNLGYNSSLIKRIFMDNLVSDSEQLKSEYDKLYMKLSKKYKDNELNYYVKQKLYQKGFEIESINNIVNK